MKYLILLLCLIITACASKPVLYPNAKYKNVGKEIAKQDIDICMAEAETFLESSKGKQILKGAAKGSIFGAVMGGVTGLITGDIGKSVARGSAIGAAAGGTGEAISPDRLKQAYTNRCLNQKGYEIIGWQ